MYTVMELSVHSTAVGGGVGSETIHVLQEIHTLRVHYVHAAANLNSGNSKYAEVARVHYFCTIALRTSRAVLTQA